MFPRRSQSVGWIVVLFLSLCVAIAVLVTPSHGWGYGEYGGCCGCQQTWCAWSATWHAPNALDTPLRPFYVPRTPGLCGREQYACQGGGYDCGQTIGQGGVAANGCGCGYPPQAGMALDPVRFERLGQIPNDMALNGLPSPAPQSR